MGRSNNLNHQETATRARIYTVSELTKNIKSLLEEAYPFIWISGEISNFRRPVSGHNYFTLKDDTAQISAVMFRGQAANLKFRLENGLTLTGFGRISVYEPRGTYQIILEYLEPGGIGALQVAFEQLKERLSAQGFFDEENKRSLPFLPKKISVVTSPTGAVIHDILNVVQRRYADLHVEIVPVKVQGHGAAEQIVSALDLLNQRNDTDVIVLARGGGSLEDLHAFNDEAVARAVFRTVIPVVSAIGHETDFSITDFVADLRAPTPSAAAEIVAPLKTELARRVKELTNGLTGRLNRLLDLDRAHLEELSGRLRDPRRRVQDARMRIDELSSRLMGLARSDIHRKRDLCSIWQDRLYANNPKNYIINIKEKLNINNYNLLKNLNIIINKKYQPLGELSGRLQALNPMAVLARGYSITRTNPTGAVVRDAREVNPGQSIEIILEKGSLGATVDKRIISHGEKTNL